MTTASGLARKLSPIVGLVLAAFFVVLALSEPRGEADVSSPLIGNPAPAIQSTVIGGGDFELSRRKGSWVVLNFFNSTCIPCIQEHPELVKFAEAQENGPDGVEVYSIINDDSDGAVREFFTARGGDWPKVRDTDGTIAVAFGVAKVPETWIIDPNGYVRLRILGAITQQFLDERFAELRSSTNTPVTTAPAPSTTAGSGG